MTTRLPLAERRSQLVDAALEVAAAEGITAATVRRVAERAGVALGVVHYCFTSKQELFVALAARIVDDLASAGAAQVTAERPVDLVAALRQGIDGMWDSVERARGAQLLTYEITTFALRHPGSDEVAVRQYEVSQSATQQLLELAAQSAGARWRRPVADLAGEALAFVDGVTLRWLVDHDSAAARARLYAFVDYLVAAAIDELVASATA